MKRSVAIILGGVFFAILLAAQVPPMPAQPELTPLTADAIVAHSLELYQKNLDAQRNYIFEKREVERRYDGKGKLKDSHVNIYEVFQPCGGWHERLISKDGQPLNEKERKKEEDKLTRECADQNKREAEKASGNSAAKRRAERNVSINLTDAYDFRMLDEDTVEGHSVYVIGASPKPSFKPDKRIGKLLTKIAGRVWIDKETYQWVRAEADLFDDFSAGWFLFKLRRGAHFEFEQTIFNGETWLPRSMLIRGSGRMLFMSGQFEQETTFGNYRKFRSDSRITGMSEPQAEPPK